MHLEKKRKEKRREERRVEEKERKELSHSITHPFPLLLLLLLLLPQQRWLLPRWLCWPCPTCHSDFTPASRPA
jgi:hypothetical protein